LGYNLTALARYAIPLDGFMCVLAALAVVTFDGMTWGR
jgi:hypothetical protein